MTEDNFTINLYLCDTTIVSVNCTEDEMVIMYRDKTEIELRQEHTSRCNILQ